MIIRDNGSLAHFSDNFPKIFSSEYYAVSGESTYRPIATISYFIYYKMFGPDPAAFRTMNLCFFGLTVVVLFFLLQGFFGSTRLSFCASIIYASHPALTEVINCITYNEDIFCGLFFLSALLLHRKISSHRVLSDWRYPAAVFFVAAALFSKEMAISFLPVAVLTDMFAGKDQTQDSQSPEGYFAALTRVFRIRWKLYAGYLLVSVLYLAVLFIFMNSPDKEKIPSNGSLFVRLMFIPFDYSQFLKILIHPFSLNADHSFSYPLSFFNIENVISCAALLILIGLIFSGKIKKGFFVYGFLWLLITLVPVSNIVEIYHPVAERYLFLPLAGFAIIAVFVIKALCKALIGSEKISTIVIYVLILIIAAANGSYSVCRNTVWASDLSLWTDAVKKHGDKPKSYFGLGDAYENRGDPNKAIEMYSKAIQLDPGYYRAYQNIGVIYAKTGHLREAVPFFLKVVEINNSYGEGFYLLGTAYSGLGDLEHAEEFLKKAIDVNGFPRAFPALAEVKFSQKRFNEASMLFKTSIRQFPYNYDLYYKAGLCEIQSGDSSSAGDFLGVFRDALEKNPDAGGYSSLGELYMRLGKPENAERYLRKALELDPDSASGHFNLAVWYESTGKYDDAVNEWKRVLRIEPDNEVAGKKLKELTSVHK
jgi:tetratricopeptide (TPR) repeat protein